MFPLLASVCRPQTADRHFKAVAKRWGPLLFFERDGLASFSYIPFSHPPPSALRPQVLPSATPRQGHALPHRQLPADLHRCHRAQFPTRPAAPGRGALQGSRRAQGQAQEGLIHPLARPGRRRSSRPFCLLSPCAPLTLVRSPHSPQKNHQRPHQPPPPQSPIPQRIPSIPKCSASSTAAPSSVHAHAPSPTQILCPSRCPSPPRRARSSARRAAKLRSSSLPRGRTLAGASASASTWPRFLLVSLLPLYFPLPISQVQELKDAGATDEEQIKTLRGQVHQLVMLKLQLQKRLDGDNDEDLEESDESLASPKSPPERQKVPFSLPPVIFSSPPDHS